MEMIGVDHLTIERRPAVAVDLALPNASDEDNRDRRWLKTTRAWPRAPLHSDFGIC